MKQEEILAGIRMTPIGGVFAVKKPHWSRYWTSSPASMLYAWKQRDTLPGKYVTAQGQDHFYIIRDR